MPVRWTARAGAGLDAIFDRIAYDDPAAAQRVVDFLVELSESLDTFPNARGHGVPGTQMREVVDSRWRRYAVRYLVGPDATVVIIDIRRIRPFPPIHLVP